MKNIASIRLVAPLCLLAATLAACEQKSEDDGSGGSGTTTTSSSGQGGGGGDTSTGGAGGSGTGGSGTGGSGSGGDATSSGSGGSGEPGWTIIPLIDDETNPDFGTQVRVGVDLVAAIRFESLDEGYVVTQATQNGGAVFRATQHAVTAVALGGRRPVPCTPNGYLNYKGIEKSPDGYYVLTNACANVSSRDGGATFEAELNSDEQLGLERLFALRSHEDGIVAVSDDYLATSPDGPAPDAVWDYIWAPEASPPIPNPVPADQCQYAPAFDSAGLTSSAHVGPDGTHIVYGSVENDETSICVSTDGGRSFFPKPISAIHPDAQGYPPQGVIFTTENDGVAWYANYVAAGRQWIAHTTDGGDTWDAVALPEEMADASVELRNGFFAPDGQHGWIVGYDYDAQRALLLKTNDGGATWARSGGDLGEKVAQAGGAKLHSGFALDADHIWVGGELGIFAASSAGGE